MSDLVKGLAEVVGAAEGAAPAAAPQATPPAPEDLLQRLVVLEQFVATWEPRLNSIMVLVGKL